MMLADLKRLKISLSCLMSLQINLDHGTERYKQKEGALDAGVGEEWATGTI